MKKVLFLQYTNPAAYPPLEHVAEILTREDWRILFLGTLSDTAETLRFQSHASVDVKHMTSVSSGWKQKFNYLRFIVWAVFWAIRWRPDWVYASDLLACQPAVLIGSLPGVRIIYHEHDSPTSAPGKFFQRLALRARRKLAHSAELCIVPNKRRAQWFSEATLNGNNVCCVWNCPSVREISEAREPSDGKDMWVLYHGSIVPSRLPVTVLQALALLPETVKLRVIGYETPGHFGYVAELQRLATELGVAHRIHFVGPVPLRADLLKWCRLSDVGLALMPKRSDDLNEQAMIGASNKPFDYLSSGLALLVADLPDWREIYVDQGYALACDPDNPQSIVAGLRDFLEHPAEMRAMGERGRRRILKDWNYEMQFAPVSEMLNGSRLAAMHLGSS